MSGTTPAPRRVGFLWGRVWRSKGDVAHIFLCGPDDSLQRACAQRSDEIYEPLYRYPNHKKCAKCLALLKAHTRGAK